MLSRAPDRLTGESAGSRLQGPDRQVSNAAAPTVLAPDDAETLWRTALDELQHQMVRATFNAWLVDSQARSLDGERLIVEVSSKAAREWLANRLSTVIDRTVTGIANRPVAVTFVIRGEAKSSAALPDTASSSLWPANPPDARMANPATLPQPDDGGEQVIPPATAGAFRGFSRPNTVPTPNEIFDILLGTEPESVLRVVLYTVRHTFGYGKFVDAISQSQFEKGILRKIVEENPATGQKRLVAYQVDSGCGLSAPAVKAGLSLAVERGYLWRFYICPSCDNELLDEDMVERTRETRNSHGAGTATVRTVPALCPYCQNSLYGRERVVYSLAFSLDSEVGRMTRGRRYHFLRQAGGGLPRLLGNLPGLMRSAQLPVADISRNLIQSIQSSLVAADFDAGESARLAELAARAGFSPADIDELIERAHDSDRIRHPRNYIQAVIERSSR